MKVTFKLILSGLTMLFLSSFALANDSFSVDTQNKVPHEAFVLFYMASCPHCQRFDPVLKKYAVSHHIPVLA